jgi:hypothetical protein
MTNFQSFESQKSCPRQGSAEKSEMRRIWRSRPEITLLSTKPAVTFLTAAGPDRV